MATFQREAKLYSDPATQDSSRLLQLVQAFLDNVRMCVDCNGLVDSFRAWSPRLTRPLAG